MIKPDQIIGRHYKILAQLGAGGMGQVYKALDVNLGREVAIKFLLEAESNVEIRQRFINEGRILATINHRAVISVYASDIDEIENVPFLVMEFIDGKPVDSFREQYLENQTLLIEHFVELLEGISACHQKGIIHRDIKPANILVNREGQLKILDFGIAKTAKKQTKTGVALGTPHYMAPEQCLGKADVTHKVDVYAIGVMFWEFLSGKLPFDAGDSAADPALAIALMHLNEPPPMEVMRSNPAISRFADLLERMLAKKPAERPEISEVIESLRKELVCSIPAHSTVTGMAPLIASAVTGRRGTAGLIGDIYQIQRELGSGGMGTVYLALDTSLNRQVAIKILNETNSKDDGLVERFIREGQMLATVGHPNIMNIYASALDRETSRPFLVMEYIDGVSLSSLKQNLLKERRSVPSLMLQLFEGIAACHAKGIIHRDLKPSNIMVTRSGLLKVLDFGIARTSVSHTKTGITMGTPEYMSPEQCMGVKDLTPASDVYTMGVIFWELIFGETPFKPDSAENPELSVALKHVNATLPSTMLIPDETFAPLLPLIRKMLDKSPAARPPLDDLIQALDAHVEEHIQATQASPATRRKSRSIRSSALQELVTASGEAPSASLLTRRSLLFGAGGIAVTAVLVYAFVLGKPDNAKLITVLKAQLEQQLIADNLDEAVRSLAMLEAEPDGADAAAPFRSRLAEALSAKARSEASSGLASPAMSLYDLARQIDPTNATAATGYATIKSELDARIEAEAKRERLVKRARELGTLVTPGSGTEELSGLLVQLRASQMASEASALESSWIDSFQKSGDAVMASDPTRAIEFFDEIQMRFPSVPGIAERIDSARKRQEEDKARLEKSRETAGLLRQLEAEIIALTAETDPKPFIGLCDKLEVLGGKAAADTYRRTAAGKLTGTAETLLDSGKKAEAVQILKRASVIFAEFPGLGERLRQTEERIAAEDEAARKEAELATRLKEVSTDIANAVPPAPVEKLLSRLSEIESTFSASSATAELRRSIFDRYLSAARQRRETEPAIALDILKQCENTGLNPEIVASERASLDALIASKSATLARQKRIEEISAALPKLVKNPAAKAADALPALLKELSELGAPEQAESARRDAVESLRDQAGKVKTTRESQELLHVLQALTGPGSSDEKEVATIMESALNTYRENRKNEVVTAIEKAKPVENSKPVVELLRELDSFEEPERVKAAALVLKKKYLEAASRLKQPAQARRLLAAAEGIPQLKGDPELRAAVRAVDEAIAEEARLAKAAEIASRTVKIPDTVVKPPPTEIKTPVATAATLPPKEQPPIVAPPPEPAEPVVGPGGFKTLAEAVAAAKPGQTIRVKQGTYKGSCVVDKNVTIEADGSRGSVILESGSGPVLTLNSNATVSGFTISFTGSSQTDAVKITGGSPTIRNCSVTSSAAAAAPFWSACIAVDGGAPTISGNTTNGSRGMGILARGGKPKISGNTCSGSAVYGAWFTDGAGGTFEGNTITGSGRSGVGVKSRAAPVIRGNKISGSKENGVFIYQDGRGTVQGNTISDNTWSGIYVGSAGKADLIADNRISGNRKHGIHVVDSGSTAVIGTNSVSGNNGEGEKAEGGGQITRR